MAILSLLGLLTIAHRILTENKHTYDVAPYPSARLYEVIAIPEMDVEGQGEDSSSSPPPQQHARYFERVTAVFHVRGVRAGEMTTTTTADSTTGEQGEKGEGEGEGEGGDGAETQGGKAGIVTMDLVDWGEWGEPRYSETDTVASRGADEYVDWVRVEDMLQPEEARTRMVEAGHKATFARMVLRASKSGEGVAEARYFFKLDSGGMIVSVGAITGEVAVEKQGHDEL